MKSPELRVLRTSDVPVLRHAGDAQQVPTLSLAGGQRLAPGEDGVQVELVARLQLLVRLPEVITTRGCGRRSKLKWSIQTVFVVVVCLPSTGQKPHRSARS